MLPKIRCRDCAYRLGNSNYCLKRQHVISVDRPKRCKDFLHKTKLHFSLEMNEEEKVIEIKPIRFQLLDHFPEKLLQETQTEARGGYKIETKKGKVHWWKRMFRLFRRVKKC